MGSDNKKGLEKATKVKIAIAIAIIALVLVVGLLALYFIQKGKVDVCNRDGVCDVEQGETIKNCPWDCLPGVEGEGEGEAIQTELLDPVDIDTSDIFVGHDADETIYSGEDDFIPSNEDTSSSDSVVIDDPNYFGDEFPPEI